MLSFLCPACRQRLTAAPEAAGKPLRCPRCQRTLLAPALTATVPSAAAPLPPGGLPTVTMPPSPPSLQETGAVSQAAAPTNAPAHRGLNLGDVLSPPRGPNELGRLGQYSVLKVLGAGGMGVVLHARDLQLERFVALKVMRPTHASEAGRQRFLREARAAAAIEHDHIIPIFQVGQERDVPFLAMPLLQGEPLDVRLKREGKLPVAEVLRIGREIALGLAAAHERGLIHRDIKPANVWLEGKNGRVKILDFGLARAAAGDMPLSVNQSSEGTATVPVSEALAGQLTQAGAILGTPSYMAPEQAAGKPIDARCDLFSLGCVLYVLSTGQLPFKGKTLSAILAAVAGHTPDAPRKVNPVVPAALSDFIMHLLAKDPAARPASAQVVAESLDRMLAAARPASGRLRRRASLAVGLLLSLAVVVLSVLLLVKAPKATTESAPHGEEPGEDYTTVVPRLTFAELAQRRSPLDDWKHETLSDVALALAGRGDPAKAPAELVGVLGDPSFRQSRIMGWLSLSPDGRFLAASNENELKLFHAQTGRLQRTLTGTRGRIFRSAFSPDSQKLAATSYEGDLRLWDVARGKQLWAAPNQGRPLWGVNFHPDGSLLVTAGDDGKVRLFDAATGEQKRILSGHEKCVFQAAFHPDGRLLATSGDVDGTVRLWDPDSGEQKKVLQHHEDADPRMDPLSHLNLAFSPDGLLLASGSDFRLKVWNARTFQEVRSVKTPAMFLAFSPDSRILFTGQNNSLGQKFHTVQRWDAASGQTLESMTLQSHGGWATLQLSPDGRTLTGAEVEDAVLRQYDVATGKLLRAEPGHTRDVIGVAFSPDGKQLASGSRDTTIKIWDLATRKELHTLAGHTAEIRHVAYSPDGKLLASCSFDHTVRLWDTATGQRVRTLAEHTAGVYGLAFSPDGKLLASSGHDKTVRLWSVANGREVHVLQGHESLVEGLAFSVDGQTLASASLDHTVRLWDVRTGKERTVRRHAAPVASVAFLPDGRTLAVGAHDNRAWLWDLDSGTFRPLPPTSHSVIYGLSVRGDGRWVAGCGNGGGVTLWDLQPTPPRQRSLFFQPGGTWVGDIAFSPEGRHVASANPDGTIYILKVPAALPTQ